MNDEAGNGNRFAGGCDWPTVEVDNLYDQTIGSRYVG